MKYLLLLAAAAALFWWVRRRWKGVPKASAPPQSGTEQTSGMNPAKEELLVPCAHCGVLIPKSEAHLVDGRYYCCDAHRHLDAR